MKARTIGYCKHGIYNDAAHFCSACLTEFEPPQQALIANWCQTHGAWALGIPRCPACVDDPPGIKTFTTGGA
jgi:hypothetical protein